MVFLELQEDLEPCDGGEGQREIADWVQASDVWLNHVSEVNENPIPQSDDFEGRPSDEWIDNQTFHPNDLIEEACESLGWLSVPDAVNLMMNFTIK